MAGRFATFKRFRAEDPWKGAAVVTSFWISAEVPL
jgi:hypothetical protein